ncbi:MAG: winged helix-turn-helix domain-containing protein [Anaerolineae bacterium]|nr:winged helix-turn-helix domain-containing protein [Anaerolineae bacterium]
MTLYHTIATANTTEGLFFVNEQGLITYCNPQLGALLRVADAHLLGCNYRAVFHHLAALDQNTQAAEQALAQALPDLAHPTVVYITSQRPPVHLRVRLFAIQASQAGEAWGGAVSDVSQEWQVFNRWTEYYLSIIHEMRTTQANVKGFVTTLLKNHTYWEDGDRQSFLESIDKGVDEIDHLLEYEQQMLSLQSGAVKLTYRLTDVGQQIQQLLNSLAIRNSGYQIGLDLPTNLPRINTDSRCLERILRYMLENAISRASVSGQICVSVQYTSRDLVIGITNQNLPRPAAPADAYATRQPNSQIISVDMLNAEFGLQIAGELAQVLGGSLRIEDTVDQGTTVFCTLPTRAEFAHRDKLPEAGQRRQKNTEARFGPHKPTVLVAARDTATWHFFQSVLEADGCQVVHAPLGSRALVQALDKTFDLILVSTDLSDVSCLDLCAEIRQESAVPLLILSNNPSHENVAQALTLGADGFLVAPSDRAVALAYIQAMIRRATSHKPVPNTLAVSVGELTIDMQRRTVTLAGKAVKLAPKEYKLLTLLASHAGQVLGPEDILAQVWGPGYKGETQNVWVYISRLRKKLEADPMKPRYILTNPGFGYALAAPETVIQYPVEQAPASPMRRKTAS